MVGPRLVRWVAIVVCAAGVAGMIATSIADSTNGALACGLVTAAGALALFLLGAVAPTRSAPDEVAAAELEQLIGDLVSTGVDEGRLRRLVRLARAIDPT